MAKSVAVQIGHYPSQGADGEVPTCLMVVPQIEARLRAAGVAVTHYDEGLWHEPPNMQHSHDAAVFIHCDASEKSSVSGFSLGYWEEKHPGSSKLAAVIKDVYGKATAIPFLRIYTDGNAGHYYGNNRMAKTCKCVLVELGFVSNPTERTFLQRNSKMVGYAVADGILKYLGVKPTEQEDEMGFAVYQSISKIGDWSTSVYLNGDSAGAWVDIINEGSDAVDVEVEIQLAKNGDIGTKSVPVKTNDGKGSSNIATFSVGELFSNPTAGVCRLTFRPSKPTITYKISQTRA